MRAGIVIAFAAMLSACAAPGTKSGRLGFSGTIVGAPANKPVTLEVMLPGSYGTTALDRMVSTAEASGKDPERVRIDVVDGAFFHEFPSFSYHAVFWLLPPLGGRPKHPPAPTYLVRFSDTPDEIYFVGFERGKFHYGVRSRTSGEVIGMDVASWAFTRGEYVPVQKGEDEVWHVKVEASRSQRPSVSKRPDG